MAPTEPDVPILKGWTERHPKVTLFIIYGIVVVLAILIGIAIYYR